MNKIIAIQKKQWKETMKNKEVLIQFLMFPLMAIIMTYSIRMEQMPKNFFVILFASMYTGMAPLMSVTALIAEEKEKGTLRMLRMSHVTALQYLLSVGSYIMANCMIGSLIFALVGEYQGAEMVQFLLTMLIGCLISTLIGAIIGMIGKSQMNVMAISMPVMMIFSFVPMIATFNDTVKSVAKILYSQQMNLMLAEVGNRQISLESMVVLGGTIVITVIGFFLVYQKNDVE